MNRQVKTGIGLAILTAIISGFSIFYNKLIIVKGIDPLIFNILKNGGVALFLTSILLAKKQISNLVRLSRRQWLKLFLIAVIGGSIPFVLYFEALKSVSAVNANLIQKSLFIWVAIMAVPLLGERLNRIQVIGYSLIAWSNLFIGGFSGFTWSRPELMIVIATMLWSIENILAKIALKNTEGMIVAWARMFIGSLILIGMAVWQGKIGLLTQITPSQMIAIGGSVLFLTAYVTSWYTALSLAPATLVTATLILSTPITNVLSAIFITHTLPVQQILNLGGTLLGIVFVLLLSKYFSNKETIAVS